jgi:hypothetical protein
MNNDEKLLFSTSKLRWLMTDLEQLAGQFTRRTQAATLVNDMRERVMEILVRINDPMFCNAPHKGIYFCWLERGHSGKHQEGNIKWGHTKSKPTKTSQPKKMQIAATSRYGKDKSKPKKSKAKPKKGKGK